MRRSHGGGKTPISQQYRSGVGGGPDDMASTIVYLCSESTFFVTGQNIHVDGALALF
ncbi:MAG: hypothetical protein M2R45_04110 [Verrucomicrobia subdivision 3 bacterium]|nr:hypothetical protein [Limisphaerales bacterium]MCS1417089.1 hypothetical protein [Limisphaerales bacterium]